MISARSSFGERQRELDRIESKEMKKGYYMSEEDEAIRAELEAEFGGEGVKNPKE